MRIPISFLAITLLAGESSLLPQVSAQNVGQEAIPSDVQKFLEDAQWKRKQTIKKRFAPVLSALAQAESIGYGQLYQNAVFRAFFAGDTKPEQAFREWKKKNKQLVEDPRLAPATKIAVLNLQAQIYQILDEEEAAMSYYNKMVAVIKKSPSDIGAFHLLQESLQESLLVKSFQLEEEYVTNDRVYAGTILELEELVASQALPWYERNRPNEVGKQWDEAIQAIKMLAMSDQERYKKFLFSGWPDLIVKKAECLNKLGKRAESLTLLKEVLSNFPEYPDYEKVEQRIIAYSTSTQKEK